MEKCIYADGWGAMGTTIEQGLFNVCGNQEGPVSVTYDWRVISWLASIWVAQILVK